MASVFRIRDSVRRWLYRACVRSTPDIELWWCLDCYSNTITANVDESYLDSATCERFRKLGSWIEASYRLNGDCLIGLAIHYRHQSPALPAAGPAIIGTKIGK